MKRATRIRQSTVRVHSGARLVALLLAVSLGALLLDCGPVREPHQAPACFLREERGPHRRDYL